ncbi:MAG: hypothetical protein F6K50_08080 [Moorea sp. SIO3I7]|uniref:hypothetical protein n=1 Tax=unclassified Moorena TaxID=2683338 RepID=UPI0013BEFFE3|nr:MULTISPECIES: hypothetical protein [unclassified Moorena]NEN95484.1 hypothetical protein [Moorena sp. SIO3I7]NEO06787.1 hypothetical protein [Moorena sp. SIO3I8]NEO18812.1 hypothetical protein [Moorena sp. SIO4A5]NEQ56804.1 hypothetical protein [Moorena sp. SIO4A1]
MISASQFGKVFRTSSRYANDNVGMACVLLITLFAFTLMISDRAKSWRLLLGVMTKPT